MRRAFTLLELMVVVGIMTFLGLAATNGYQAMQRGMAERGAVDAVSALLKAAKERAAVDRVPTVVYCWNRLLWATSDDENAIVVGEAVAVRRAGRITRVAGKLLYDEFGDLDGSFDTVVNVENLDKRGGIRLWQIDDRQGAADRKYSIVSDGVFLDKDIGCVSFMPWGDRLGVAGGTQWSNNVVRACAFYEKSAQGSNWKVGTAYGFEFQNLRLPDGFIFGTAVPASETSDSFVKAIHFDPSSLGDGTVEISVCHTGVTGIPVRHHGAGTASSAERAAK